MRRNSERNGRQGDQGRPKNHLELSIKSKSEKNMGIFKTLCWSKPAVRGKY